MTRALVCFVLIALACAEEAEPSTVESTFTPFTGLTNPVQVASQYLLSRRFADITLGLQVAQGFASFGAAEFAKFNTKTAAPSSFEAETEELVQAPRRHLEEDDAEALEEMGAEEFLELKDFTGQPMVLPTGDLEFQSTQAKTTALKALHLQLYLSAGDVENSYWAGKVAALSLPPQLSYFKLYKSYLNTLALSLAYKFHDAYTFEAIIDDFNDRTFSTSTDAVEASAELHVYSHWVNLVSIKWQLFLISIYEQSFAMAPQANANNANANNAAFLETEAETEFVGAGNPAALLSSYSYMAYYTLMLKYYSLTTELSLAQTGMYAATLKSQLASSPSDDNKLGAQLEQLEGQALPHLYTQWASTNQMKYYIEYSLLMFEMQYPALAFSQASQRAENTFINLFQSGKAETFAAPESSTKSN